MALPEPGPIALRAINEAEMNVGVREEGGNNRGKWVEIYLKAVNLVRGNPWCCAFICFRLEDAARDLSLSLPKWVPMTGYTPTFANAAKKAGRWITTADARYNHSLIKRGDLVFFYYASKGRIAHVEIVAKVGETGVYSVGGNTSDSSGVNRDGGGVYRNFRSWSKLGSPTKSGFARLDF